MSRGHNKALGSKLLVFRVASQTWKVSAFHASAFSGPRSSSITFPSSLNYVFHTITIDCTLIGARTLEERQTSTTTPNTTSTKTSNTTLTQNPNITFKKKLKLLTCQYYDFVLQKSYMFWSQVAQTFNLHLPFHGYITGACKISHCLAPWSHLETWLDDRLARYSIDLTVDVTSALSEMDGLNTWLLLAARSWTTCIQIGRVTLPHRAYAFMSVSSNRKAERCKCE